MCKYIAQTVYNVDKFVDNLWFVVEKCRLFLYQFLSQLDCFYAIRGISIGSGTVGIFLRDCGTADHDFSITACFFEVGNDFVNLDHCRGHECTKTDNIGVVFDGSSDDIGAVHILTEVD